MKKIIPTLGLVAVLGTGCALFQKSPADICHGKGRVQKSLLVKNPYLAKNTAINRAKDDYVRTCKNSGSSFVYETTGYLKDHLHIEYNMNSGEAIAYKINDG